MLVNNSYSSRMRLCVCRRPCVDCINLVLVLCGKLLYTLYSKSTGLTKSRMAIYRPAHHSKREQRRVCVVQPWASGLETVGLCCRVRFNPMPSSYEKMLYLSSLNRSINIAVYKWQNIKNRNSSESACWLSG